MKTTIDIEEIKSWTMRPIWVADFFTGKVALVIADETGQEIEIIARRESVEGMAKSILGIKPADLK